MNHIHLILSASIAIRNSLPQNMVGDQEQVSANYGKFWQVLANSATSGNFEQIQENMNSWMLKLIEILRMKPLIHPVSVYCEMPGNRGITSICAIETSSITLHIWDEPNPAKLQLDIYTCSELNIENVLNELNDYFGELSEVKYLIIDRERDFEILSRKV